jgi:hypothetical protein
MAFMPIGKFLYPEAALSFRFYIPYLPFGLPAQFVKAVTANFSTITQTAHPRAVCRAMCSAPTSTVCSTPVR